VEDEHQYIQDNLGPIIVCLNTSIDIPEQRQEIMKGIVFNAMRAAVMERRGLEVFCFDGHRQEDSTVGSYPIRELQLSLNTNGLAQLMQLAELSLARPNALGMNFIQLVFQSILKIISRYLLH